LEKLLLLKSEGNLNKCCPISKAILGSLPSSIITKGFLGMGFPSINCLRFVSAPCWSSSSLLFRAFLFIYHHLLNALASLPSFRCQERSRSVRVPSSAKNVAVRLRCNIASSCHILPTFRPNSRCEGRGKRQSEGRAFPHSFGFDTSNNLLGFRLKSYR